MSNEWDVVVVGAGGSGLAAAWSATQLGAQVLVLEKRPQPGGTTGIAVGSFTAAGTSLQRQSGIIDTPQSHAADAARFASPPVEALNNHALRDFFLTEAATTYEWLRQLGLSFVGPSPEPPNSQPRMHNVVPGAKAYIAAFQMALAATRTRIECDSPAVSLLREYGRVVGVAANVRGNRQELRAHRGVILAAGDYAGNAELIAAHKGEGFRQIEGINPFAGGDGHLLAASAGAQLLNMAVTYGPELRFVTPHRRPFQQWLPSHRTAARIMAAVARRLPRQWMHTLIKRLLVTWQHPENKLFDDGAILVNSLGQRFCDERQSPDREIAVAKQPGKIAYLLLDQRLVKRYSQWPHFISTAPDIAYAFVSDYQRLRPDVTACEASLDQLARRRGLDPAALVHTVSEFNTYVRGEQPDAWRRRGDSQELTTGPWILLGPVKAFFTTTEGGAAINLRMQVLDANSQAIPGLYAVGQNGLGGMILWGHGLHIAWALTSGRLAGQAIMQHEQANDDASV